MSLGMLHHEHHRARTSVRPHTALEFTRAETTSLLLQNIILQNIINHSGHVKHSQVGAISLKTIELHTQGKECNLNLGSFHCPSGRTFKQPLKKTYRIMFYKSEGYQTLKFYGSWPDYIPRLSLFYTIWEVKC